MNLSVLPLTNLNIYKKEVLITMPTAAVMQIFKVHLPLVYTSIC